MSVCLHLAVGTAVFFFMPLALDAPIKSIQTPPITIEFVSSLGEASPTSPESVVEAQETSEPLISQALNAIPEKVSGVEITLDTADEVTVPQVQPQNSPLNPQDKVRSALAKSSFTLENGDVVSMADWIKAGITKNDLTADATDFERRMFLGQVARSMMEARPMPDTNPLAGDGQIAAHPFNVEELVSRHAMSLIKPAPKARDTKDFSPAGPGDQYSSGANAIRYAANVSNCAHEEARTGINRCNDFDRWVSQKVVEYLKAKGE